MRSVAFKAHTYSRSACTIFVGRRKKKSRFECEDGFLKSGSASWNNIGNSYCHPRLKCGSYWTLSVILGNTREDLLENGLGERNSRGQRLGSVKKPFCVSITEIFCRNLSDEHAESKTRIRYPMLWDKRFLQFGPIFSSSLP